MKKIVLCTIGLLVYACVVGQSRYIYEELVARAGLYHLQRDYRRAIPLFEKAFQIRPPDFLNAYKAAGVYALDSNTEKAFFYLHLALRSGWREAEALTYDPYFQYLREVDSAKWREIMDSATLLEQQYATGLKLPALRRKINDMGLWDQRLRYARIQTKNEREKKKIDRALFSSDSTNHVEAKAIIQEYGWPTISEIGKDGQNNLWLVVQHADDDVFFQEQALAAMQKLLGTHQINLENYAFLYDRIQCNLNYKQLYGTQVNWTADGEASGFRSIAEEGRVDDRRGTLGMLPLRIYALTYGFRYVPVTGPQAQAKERADSLYTQHLIDSAQHFYLRKDFNQVYNYYNAASMILGGMSNTDNFKAAVLFAKIARRDQDEKHRSISLDFLNLLSQRGVLSKDSLDSHKAFEILQKEPRWVLLHNQLSP